MKKAGCVVWFTGLSGSGKSTIAGLLHSRLSSEQIGAELIDGDVVRTQLCSGLGFSRADRDENIRRIGFICELLTRHDVIVIVAAISPYRTARDRVRAHVPAFVEVFMDCPVSVLIERDKKGLYRQALAGEIENFTGVSDPYEPPAHPDLTIRSDQEAPEESVNRVWAALKNLGMVP